MRKFFSRFTREPADGGGGVLVGCGIGVTPVLSMLNTLVAQGSRREIWFFHGIRNHAEHVMKEHISKQSRAHTRTYTCTFAPVNLTAITSSGAIITMKAMSRLSFSKSCCPRITSSFISVVRAP